MARFDRSIALAERLIKKNGEQSTLRRKVDGAPVDPAKPWKPGTPTFTDFTVSSLWLDFDARRIDGQLIKEGDQQVFMPASELGTILPDASTDHVVRVSGQKWEVIRVETLQPNEQLIMHVLQVRK